MKVNERIISFLICDTDLKICCSLQSDAIDKCLFYLFIYLFDHKFLLHRIKLVEKFSYKASLKNGIVHLIILSLELCQGLHIVQCSNLNHLDTPFWMKKMAGKIITAFFTIENFLEKTLTVY